MSSSSSSTSETCTSRHFTWLIKSCLPSPTTHTHPSPHLPPPPTTISSLPDDLLLECLSRVSPSTLPSLPSVSRLWSHLLSSPSFPILRLRHHPLSRSLFSLSFSLSTLSVSSLPFPMHSPTSTYKLSSFILNADNAISPDFSSFSHFRLVSVSRKIYTITPTSMLCFDTWTGTLLPKSPTLIPRKKFAAATLAGKILVAGGTSRSSSVEQYDPDENTWRVVSNAPRKRYGCIGAATDGVFYVIGGLKMGACGTRAADYAGSMDLYDVVAGVWLRSRVVPCGGCVVAACAAGDGCVYVLSSHAVEVSFWKFNAVRRSEGFGEWVRLKGPPLMGRVRLDSTVRFSCVGVGEKVVLVQVVGCIDDLLRRSGRGERGIKEGLVLVYDCGCGEWSRGVDMPEVIRRAGCVCVEC